MAYQITTASGIPDVAAQIAVFAAANAGFTNEGSVVISGRTVQRLSKNGMFYHMAQQFDGTNFMRYGMSKEMFVTDWKAYDFNPSLYTGPYPKVPSYVSFMSFAGPYPGLYMFTDGKVVHVVIELTNGIYNHFSFGEMTKTDTFVGGEFMVGGVYTYWNGSNAWYDLVSPFNGNSPPWLNYFGQSFAANPQWMYLPPASGPTNDRFDWISFGGWTYNAAGLLPRCVRANNRDGIMRTLLDRSPNAGTLRSVMLPQIIDIFDPVSQLWAPAGHIPNMRLMNMRALDEKEVIYTDWQVFPITQRNGSGANIPNSQNSLSRIRDNFMPTFSGVILADIVNLKGVITPPWLDEPVELKRHPEGVLASLLFAGVETDNSPIDIESEPFNGVILQSFGADFYNRIHVTPARIDAGNVVTEQVYPVTIFNGFFEPATFDALTGSEIEGISFAGIAIPALMQPLATLNATITIGTEGPPSIDGVFKFEFDIYQDIFMPITGQRVIALPYQPSAPYVEKLEWKNEILTVNNGEEQRILHRFKPRQTFSGKYPVPPLEMSRASNLIYGWLGQRWAVPVWSESQLVRNITPGTNVINCDTLNSDLRVNGLLLIWGSSTAYEVLEIQSISIGSLTTKKTVANRYTAAMVMPVRSGTTPEAAQFRKSNYGGEIAIDYTVVDNIELATTAPTQFLNEDLYTDPIYVGTDGGWQDTIQTRIDRVDYGATFSIYLPWLQKKMPRTARYVLQNLAEAWTFRKWLHRRKGTNKPFWLPTFENDMRLRMTGVVSSSLIVESDDYKGFADGRNHIAIELDNGTWQIRTIQGSSTIDTTTIAIAIDTALNVDASRIRRISFLSLYRLASDSVEINWIGNSVAECELQIIHIGR